MKDLTLLLTSPCAQVWEEMQPAGTGRYCDQCNKNIVDLTSKSDVELIRFFKNKNENVCGRLLSSQLNRELVMPVSKPSWNWLVPFAVGAFAFSPARAQQLKPVVVDHVNTPESHLAPFTSGIAPSVLRDSISGRVIDQSTDKPLTGVKIRQKGFENVLAITDSTGRFELAVKEDVKSTPFIFELFGYSTIERLVIDDIVVKMAAADLVIRIGGVTSVSSDKKPLFILHAGKKSLAVDEHFTLDQISPNWIEKLEILKDADATAIYGSKAANGVVVITIKKSFEKRIDFSNKR